MNISDELRYNLTMDYLNNLMNQINTNHNITQSNITVLTYLIQNMNMSISEKLSNIEANLTQMANNTQEWQVSINNSLEQIKQTQTNHTTMLGNIIMMLSASSSELTVNVNATPRCLLGTNWIVQAKVTDSNGRNLNPYDGVNCTISTSVWGDSDMTYQWHDAYWKYSHACDSEGTFQWSVDCS
jgi:hypothetical protein